MKTLEKKYLVTLIKTIYENQIKRPKESSTHVNKLRPVKEKFQKGE